MVLKLDTIVSANKERLSKILEDEDDQSYEIKK